MNQLYILSERLVSGVNMTYEKYLNKSIVWTDNLIAIRGSRGVGKTTFLLQHIRKNGWSSQQALYVSFNHIWFATHFIIKLAEYHYTYGGKSLFLDKVHRYPNWIQELKNISDYYPQLQVVFTGSSILLIDNTIANFGGV